MATVTVGGSWVPAVPPLKFSALRGRTKTQKFSGIITGVHTLLIMADVGISMRGGAVDKKRKIQAHVLLTDKHGNSCTEDDICLDAGTPFISYTFNVSPQQSPCLLKLSYQAEHVRFFRSSKIFSRVVDGDLIRSESDLAGAAKRLSKDFPVVPWEMQDVRDSLLKWSESRSRASQHGLARPFLLLATTHAVTRAQIAKRLNIKSLSLDAHQAAETLLTKKWTGLQARSQDLYHKALGHSTDWTTILKRALLEFQPLLLRYWSLAALQAKFSRGSFSGAVFTREEIRLEREFVLRLADFVSAATKDNDPDGIIDRANALASNPPALLADMFEKLDQVLLNEAATMGKQLYTTQDLHLLHILVVQIALTTSCSPGGKRRKRSAKSSSGSGSGNSSNVALAPVDQPDGEGQNTLSAQERDAATVTDTVYAQVFWGRCKPSRSVPASHKVGVSEKLMGHAQRSLIKKVVLTPLAPWLIQPFVAYTLANKFVGSSSKLVFVVVCQLMVHKLWLGMLGIGLQLSREASIV